MSTSKKNELSELAILQKETNLPSLSSGFGKIPGVVFFAWLSVFMLEIFLIPESGGYSLVCLALFFLASLILFPLLTYISVYAVMPEEAKRHIKIRKLEKLVKWSSVLVFSSVIFACFLLFFKVDSGMAYILPLMVSLALMLCNWLLFSEERAILARTRDIINNFNLLNGKYCEFLVKRGVNENHDINPMNGLPMINSAIDVLGNPRGVNED